MYKKVFLLLSLICILATGCNEQPANEYQGYLSARYTQISSNASGKLLKLFVTRGERIKAGKLLYKLDPMPEESTLKGAKADLINAQETLSNLTQGSRKTILEGLQAQLENANANLRYQTKELARNKKLYQENTIGLAQFQQVQNEYESAVAKVNQIKANLAEAELGSRKHLIKAQQAAVEASKEKIESAKWSLLQKQQYAPVNGLVFDTLFQQGEFVPLNQPVISIIAPKNLLLIFFIPEPKLRYLSLGKQISFTIDGQDEHYKATVRYIYPNAEYTPPVIYSNDMRYKLVYRVEASINQENLKLLHPGQPVNVYLN